MHSRTMPCQRWSFLVVSAGTVSSAMTTIMAFLALAVSVVKNVMAAAVEIREENDLTV